MLANLILIPSFPLAIPGVNIGEQQLWLSTTLMVMPNTLEVTYIGLAPASTSVLTHVNILQQEAQTPKEVQLSLSWLQYIQ